MLAEGFQLMLFGMGFVFVFLSLLIISTTAMSKIVTRWFPELPAPESKPNPAAITAAQDESLLVVISAAVHRYRARRKP